jgi:transposase
MPKIKSGLKLERIERLKKEVLKLNKKGGYTTREIGELVGRSHNWVANVIRAVDKPLD